MVRSILGFVLIATAPAARADTAASQDTRLGVSAAEVHAIMSRAANDQLPTELLADKVSEGLAKGVPPARIVVVVRGLAEALGHARADARPFVAGPLSGPLLKALVEVHGAGATSADAGVVLHAGGRERAIEVLTDLVQRGYPASDAARVVSGLCGRAAALDQLVGQAERLRNLDGATAGDALDAIARANAQGLGLDHAEQLLHHGEAGDNNGRGPNRETSGVHGPKAGGVAAPGHGKGKP